MKYAVINTDNVVENLIICEPDFSLPGMILIQSDTSAIGDIYDQKTGLFAKPVLSNTDQEIGILRSDFTIWSAITGVRATIEDISEDKSHPLRPSALALKDFLLGGVSEWLNLSNTNNQNMIDSWVKFGIISPEQKNELLALAKPIKS